MNYIANPLSRKAIRSLTNIFRKTFDISPKSKFPIVTFIEFSLLKVGFKYEIIEDSQMKNKYAEAIPEEKRLLIRESTYDGAVCGHPRDLFTLAHEIGHLFLHRQSTIRLARVEDNIKAYQNPEWQANVFAAELLVPADAIVGMTEDEVVNRYGCSKQVAHIQLKEAQKIATYRLIIE